MTIMEGFLDSFTGVGFKMLPMAYAVVGGTTTHGQEGEQGTHGETQDHSPGPRLR